MYHSLLSPYRRTLVFVYNKFFCVLSSFHFQSHNPKYSIKFRFPSKSAFKNGGRIRCLGAESKEKKYLVKFTCQVDKWSYLFLKQSTRGETYAKGHVSRLKNCKNVLLWTNKDSKCFVRS